MSTDNNLWMGDIQPWMSESYILQAFKYYKIHPLSVKLIKDKKTNINKNYCFINFVNIEEANKTLFMLNGKPIVGTQIKFKLNWATYFSSFNKSVYVGNLSSDVDDISLYELFKNKYPSVHHASVITDKGKSKGFGFVLFREEDDYEKCLLEMDGIEFHGNKIRVNEQRKKEEDSNFKGYNDNIENNSRININYDNSQINNDYNQYYINNNGINSLQYFNNSNNTNLYPDNNIMGVNPNVISYNNYNNSGSFNNIINYNINKIKNIGNANNINNTNNTGSIGNNISNIDLNEINSNREKENNYLDISDYTSFYPKKINSLNIDGNIIEDNINNIPNQINNFSKSFSMFNKKLKNKLEILNKYNNITIMKKIDENLNKLYNYYSNIYQGDISKLKCKFILLIKYIHYFLFI